MTEESDDPDNSNGLIEHEFSWRSPSKSHTSLLELNLIVEVLDERPSKNNS